MKILRTFLSTLLVFPNALVACSGQSRYKGKNGQNGHNGEDGGFY